MAGKYYVGIVLEASHRRIKVLRKTKIYQFSSETLPNVVLGSWINFSLHGNSETPVIEPVSPVLPTKVVKLCSSDDSTINQILVQTVAAVPNRENAESSLQQHVWSPHFGWILDEDGVFLDEQVESNVIYCIWIKLLNDEPSSSSCTALTKVVEIVRPSNDQLPIYDAPWMGSEMPADAELLSVHCLQNRPKGKINPAAVYSGLVLWCNIENRQKQIALWCAATGIVYFRHPECTSIAIGAWLDFVVRISRDGVLLAHNLKYSKNRMVPTKAVKGRAQVCEKMKIPEEMPKEDWSWVSDVVGKVWVNVEQFKKSITNRWYELTGSTTCVWLSCDQFNSNVYWKFESLANLDEFNVEEGIEDIERLADLVIL